MQLLAASDSLESLRCHRVGWAAGAAPSFGTSGEPPAPPCRRCASPAVCDCVKCGAADQFCLLCSSGCCPCASSCGSTWRSSLGVAEVSSASSASGTFDPRPPPTPRGVWCLRSSRQCPLVTAPLRSCFVFFLRRVVCLLGKMAAPFLRPALPLLYSLQTLDVPGVNELGNLVVHVTVELKARVSAQLVDEMLVFFVRRHFLTWAPLPQECAEERREKNEALEGLVQLLLYLSKEVPAVVLALLGDAETPRAALLLEDEANAQPTLQQTAAAAAPAAHGAGANSKHFIGEGAGKAPPYIDSAAANLTLHCDDRQRHRTYAADAAVAALMQALAHRHKRPAATQTALYSLQTWNLILEHAMERESTLKVSPHTHRDTRYPQLYVGSGVPLKLQTDQANCGRNAR
eukprot:GHVT01016373.1.p1 GENE.GHVT01016373.1~~GHVT01016373.1.p1  ORF type:complete len:403 (-),score=106.26 GHVT01016373.1:1186-2394(-)